MNTQHHLSRNRTYLVLLLSPLLSFMLLGCEDSNTSSTPPPENTINPEPEEDMSQADASEPPQEDQGSNNSDPTPPDDSLVLLSDTDRLLRIAMTLKGTRPTLEEFEAVEQDPAAFGDIVDAYLESPEFADTIRDIENQTLLVRTERTANTRLQGADLSVPDLAYYRSEEPLKLIEYVVTNNLPYTEILTMEGTLGSRYHDQLWANVEGTFDPNGPDWQVMRYTDNRGTAGVLTTNGWHARWASNPNNAHRLGAAEATAALICADYLTGDVQLGSVDLTDEDAITNAILEEPACVSCHQTMDPFANALFGFVHRVQSNAPYPTTMFQQRDADTGPRFTGRDTGYYGLGGDNLTDVAALMAQDTRFSSCTARRYLAWMTQKPLDNVPLQEVAGAQAVLIDQEMNLKAMVKHIVLSDAFAVSHSTDDNQADDTHGILHTRPRQLDRFFRSLTGFTWRGSLRGDNTYVVPRSTQNGFQVHGGGIETDNKRTPVHLHSATGSAFLRSFAAEAASYVVTDDFAKPSDQRRLLRVVEPDTQDEALLRQQLTALHLEVLGERVASDSEEVSDSLALFRDLEGINNNRNQVWIMVLTAMFQDLRVATY